MMVAEATRTRRGPSEHSSCSKSHISIDLLSSVASRLQLSPKGYNEVLSVASVHFGSVVRAQLARPVACCCLSLLAYRRERVRCMTVTVVINRQEQIYRIALAWSKTHEVGRPRDMQNAP